MANWNPFRCKMCGKVLGYKPRDAIYCCATCRKRAFDINRALDKGLPISPEFDATSHIISVTGTTPESTAEVEA